MQTNLNGYHVYQQNKYTTASPHRLITMLYDGAIRFAKQAITCIAASDILGKTKAVQRFQDIIYELLSSLNFKEGKEIAENLSNLYNYVLDLSNQSSIELKPEPLQEAIQIMTELKTAWEQIGKEVQMNG